jgi:hypothetical protein
LRDLEGDIKANAARAAELVSASEPAKAAELAKAAAKAEGMFCALNGITGESDGVGQDTSLHFNSHADWVRRDDPYQQSRDFLPGSFPTGIAAGLSWTFGTSWFKSKRASKFNISKDLTVVLPGTESIFNIPNVVLAERNRLHILGMEYNPVYYAPPPRPPTDVSGTTTPATPTPAAPSPGSATASASGSGGGTTTVTVSGSGTVSASTSGTASTAATATAANPIATQDKSSSSPADPLTGCKQDQCAAVLVRFAEPLDPNLAVTVRGLPLRRVRDWRGRGTSILTPAQSASDIPPAATPVAGLSASPVQPGRENAPSASLLEADLPGPNTWMAVDSHRVLVNISRDLAGDKEFPTIQILDPTKRALFIPLELDTGYSELIMNGFHFPTRDGRALRDYLGYHLSRLSASPNRSNSPDFGSPPGNSSDLHPAGPYPNETFLPLFLPRRPGQEIDAYLGETGIEILVSLDNPPPDPASTTAPEPKHWLAAGMQVVLEDRYLDLAWSLTCYRQGSQIACDVPRQEIRDAYDIVRQICFLNNASPNPSMCPSISNAWSSFPSISTLQVWVEQYDPEGDDAFYTPIPARLSRFPVQPSSDTGPVNTGPDVGFSPWHFESAGRNWVMLTGCRYPNFPPRDSSIRILGQHIPGDFRAQLVGASSGELGCFWFTIPTVALTRPEVVIEYPTMADPAIAPLSLSTDPATIPHTALSDSCSISSPTAISCRPESLSVSQYQPSFGDPQITPQRKPDGSFAIDSWRVAIPVGRVDCKDSLDIPGFENPNDIRTAELEARWMIGTFTYDVRRPGNTDNQACPIFPDWNENSRTGQIRLTFKVTRENLSLFLQKKDIHLIRGQNQYSIATLPDIRSLLLPTKLTAVAMGKNQFALEGPGAEAIDQVALQGPGGPFPPYNAATGAGIALINIPETPDTKPSIANVLPASGRHGAPIVVSGKNLGSRAGTVTVNGVPATVVCWNPDNIGINVPLRVPNGLDELKVTVLTTPPTTLTWSKNLAVENGATQPVKPVCKPAAPAAKAPPVPGPATYTVLPLVAWRKDTDGKQQYLPLDVTDPQGKPLTYAIPEAKPDNAATPKPVESPTTTLTISKKTSTTPAPPITPAPAK